MGGLVSAMWVTVPHDGQIAALSGISFPQRSQIMVHCVLFLNPFSCTTLYTFMTQPRLLLIISRVPVCAVWTVRQSVLVRVWGSASRRDVAPALRCLGVKAAGVITTSDGLASCRTVLNIVGKSLSASATTCTISACR